MKLNYIFSMLLFFTTQASAQQITKSERRAFDKYATNVTSNIISNEKVLIVKFKTELTKKQIADFKPLRQLSPTSYIIREEVSSKLGTTYVHQEKANTLWKAGDKLIAVWEQYQAKNKYFLISIALSPETTQAPTFLSALKSFSFDAENHVVRAEIIMADLLQLLNNREVLFADIVQRATEEIVINGIDLSVNEVSGLRLLYPEINGTGITISLKEGMFDKEDIDIAGNIGALPAGAGPTTSHATIMATLAAGRGNTFIRGRGAAPFARLSSSDFSNLMPDDIKELNALRINVQNHSYGTDIDNIYGIEAVAYDKQIFESDTMIHVFSSGNKGTSAAAAGVYEGLTNIANLTGNFKQAKNVIVVGGINKDAIAETLSSKGPAYDGRVKPEIVAIGEDGTSGAAALTSGVVALLQQEYKSIYQKAAPTAVMKSILFNSAEDIGSPQVDYITGFGKLNALQALLSLREARFKTGTVANGEDFVFSLQIPQPQKEVKVTLVWNDPPAPVNSMQALINRLDLEIKTPAGETVLPWVLSSYPAMDSLLKPAVRGRDDNNNVQQLSLENIPAGTYLITVKGRNVTQATQAFAISWQMKSPDSFHWTYPQKDGEIFSGEENYIRWSSTFSGRQGQLSLSYDNGTSWTPIAATTPLSSGFFKWTAPGVFSRAVLKMEIAGQEFISPSFIISRPPTLEVGYNCADKILFHWKPQQGATGYTLYNLKDNMLVALSETTDTTVTIDKLRSSSPYFALAARAADFNSIKSYTIDYNTQGVSCYTRTFTAEVNGENVDLNLVLGSTSNLKKLIWEKQTTPGVFISLAETPVVTGRLVYTEQDKHPVTGIQFYRVTFETTDGIRINSDLLPVNFLRQNDFVTFPNPVTDYLSVVSGDYDPYLITLYNLSGQRVFSEQASGAKQFNLSELNTGLYIGAITRNGETLKTIKLIKN